MSQNRASLVLTDTQLSGMDLSLDQLEGHMVDLISLNEKERPRLKRLGGKSELFCRQTIGLLRLNLQVVPPALNLADAEADLLARDQLRVRLQRLQRLVERAVDTEAALGSDVMDCALQGYQLLKVAGKNQGLEGLRKELGVRFARSRRSPAAPRPIEPRPGEPGPAEGSEPA